ncbi:MAG TPA: glycosyltransferase family 2 protein [Thermoplasmata archaeon]|nr:glycosyltransferase family 2 protein [Thermoplasmata archaeon]
MPPRATLVVPTLDEASSIGHVLRTFRSAAEEANRTIFATQPLDWEVLVVDGASTDGTAEIARAEGARVLVERRPGYGRAYKTGFAAATGDLLATADGDATYPVELIPALVKKLRDESLDFISGNRMAYLDRRAMTTEHRLGNRALNLFLGVAFHRFLKEMPQGGLVDSQSGFWVFRREVLDHVHLGQDGMAFSEELKIEVILRGLRVAEVPIHYGERWGRPKLSSWRDGYRNMVFLARKRLAVAREDARGAPVPFARDPEAVPPP